MKYCDLHCHSTYSDGKLSPEELVELAIKSELGALALTDHNTGKGLEKFFEAANGKLEVCGGCEITTEDDGQELHLLGLFLDDDKMKVIQSALDEQLARKEQSNKETIENLAEDGYDVSYAEFIEKFGDGVKNRVQIANYLIEKGYVSSINEAFKGLLSSGMKYYKETKKLDFYKMIALIKEAGGVSVWAHPLFHVDREKCEIILQKAKATGLDGAEVYYSTYTEDDTKFMQQMCEKYQLLESGGSDFHGENKPDIQLGIGRGNLRVPMSCYEKLKELANERNK